MKEYISIALLLLFSVNGRGQNISMETISSGGEFVSNTSVSLSSTTGELMSATHTGGGNQLAEGFEQQFYSYWTGKVNSSWNNTLNWKGGPVPGKHTDVIIISGCPFYPVLNQNASCRSLKMKTGAQLTMLNGYVLTVTN